MAPVRIQLKRTKGWRMPPNTVKVTRPSKWGNPYRVGQKARLAFEPLTDAELDALDLTPKDIDCGDGVIIEGAAPLPPNRIIYFDAPLTVEDVILLFHKHIIDRKIDVSPLRGKNLACWCAIARPAMPTCS